MSKRQRRKEEEARIIEEFDEALAQERGEKGEKTGGEFIPEQQEVFHCKRCKTKMEKGVCPVCGYKMYQPMTEGERKKIRTALTVVCIGVFLVLFLILKLK